MSLTACHNAPSLTVTSVDNPTGPRTRLPNVSSHPAGAVISWVEPTTPQGEQPEAAPANALRYCVVDDEGNWTAPVQIASGSDWFINWADFPGVYAQPSGQLSAHWLKRSGDSTYAYDVVSSQSRNGSDWSAPRVVHLDGTQSEHGFVSYFSHRGQTSMVWLDGRNTPQPGAEGHSDHAHTDQAQPAESAMSLRTQTLTDNSAALSMSTLLDARVCDCCQTAAANTASGAVVFYRDRSPGEVRDIAFVRLDADTQQWSEPQLLHNDDWQISGCPVNGPQADARGNFIAVAWFTAMPSPRVLAAVSTDGGITFGEPTIVSANQVVGRVDVVMLGNNRFLVSFVESRPASGTESEVRDTALVKVTLFDPSLSALASTTAAAVDASRRSGFPRMAALGNDGALLAWTDWQDNQSSVKTAIVRVR